MARSLRSTRPPVFVSVAMTAAIVAACGAKPASQPRDPSASASASASVRPSSPPSGLPPMATMPPPGVAGSSAGAVTVDEALFRCAAGASARGDAPLGAVKKLGEACKAVSKMSPLGAPVQRSQADRDAHQEHGFHARAGKCYRVYFAADAGVADSSLVLRDTSGAMIARSATGALPDDGRVCFTRDDDVTLLVGIGSGKGSWAVQVWSD